MSKLNNCVNCNRSNLLIENQKSKIQLLETRLKDLIRAYKLVCKERDNLQQAISSSSSLSSTTTTSSIINQIDKNHHEHYQQKRIAELEENVCNMSKICGELENGRKLDEIKIQNLQKNYQSLQDELNLLKNKNTNKTIIKFNDNYCQTDIIIIEKIDNSTQTQELIIDNDDDNDKQQKQQTIEQKDHQQIINKTNETAIVTPLIHDKSNDYDDDNVVDNCSNYDNDHNDSDTRLKLNFQQQQQQYSSNISLFHLNELARKELELSDYRLRIREYECLLRELQWNYSNDRYKYQSKIVDLEKLNKNLMAANTNNNVNNKMNEKLKNNQKLNNNNNNNNINVAYIKNVLNKLMNTTVDKQQQKLMMDALLTALDSI